MIIDALKKQKEILEQSGLSVAYICVYGSQNYGLDVYSEEYASDLDMKAIIVPTLNDLVKNSKPISMTVDTEWGQCDVKDIRVYFETLLKANPAYIETLFTDYFIVDEKFADEFNEIFSLREGLVSALKAQFIRAMYGMMCEKEKALCHPYPSIAHKIEKYGYDGKQAHHIYRLYLMMKSYYRKKLPLEKCFYPPEHEIQLLIDIKLNIPSLSDVKCFVEDIMYDAKNLKDDILKKINESTIDYSIKHKFVELSQEIIKNKIIQEIKNGGM